MLTPTSGTLADYNSAILNGNSTHVRLVFPVQNVTLTDDDISADGGLRISTVLNPDTDLTMGKAVSTELTVRLLNSGTFTGFDWTEEFHVDMGVEQSGVTNWVTVGYFKGKKPERLLRTEVIEFTAYDRMQLFDVLADEFIDSLTFPMTVINLFNALMTYIGLTRVNGDGINNVTNIQIAENPFVHGVTCRQILAWIAETYCCYIRINADGNVQTRWYRDQTSTYSIDGDNYFDINLDESSAPVIDSVRVSNSQEDTGFIYPVGGNNVIYQIIDNPILWNMPTADRTTVMTNMVSRFSAFGAYTPCAVNAVGNWMVEVGDIIEVGYDNGSAVNMPIFSKTLTWNGGCSDTYECTGKTDRTELTEAQKQQYETGGQLANKYTIRSGVDITEQGVTISGGKYLKLISGGVLDVQSTNFTISSADKKMICGNWTFDDDGIFWKDDTVAQSAVNSFHMLMDNSGGIEFYRTFKGLGDTTSVNFSKNGDIIVKNSNGITPYSPSCAVGSSSYPFANIYSNKYSGSGVKNNLTTTDSGYVLDARQGKALNDKFANYKPTQTAKSSPSTSGATNAFIDTISQNAQGVITATKKSIASSFSIPASGSKTFNIGNSFRGVIFVVGGSTDSQDAIMVYSTSSGSIAYSRMLFGSALTITTGTGTIKIANSKTFAQSTYVMVFSGSVS